MTTVDFSVLTIVAAFGLFGFFSGAVRQLAHWAALTLAYFAARPLAGVLSPHATPVLGLPPALMTPALSAVSFLTVYVAATLAASFLMRRLIGAHATGRANRAGGFLLGAAKGGAGVFGAIAMLLVFEKPLIQRVGPPPSAVRDSAAVAFVRRHNLIAATPPPALAKLEKLMAAARNPEALVSLQSNPELKAVLDDPVLKAALQSGDWDTLQKDPRFAAISRDSNFPIPAR